MPVLIDPNPPRDRAPNGNLVVRVSGQHPNGACRFRLVDSGGRTIRESAFYGCDRGTVVWAGPGNPAPDVRPDQIQGGFVVLLDGCNGQPGQVMDCMNRMTGPSDSAVGLPQPPVPMAGARVCPPRTAGNPCQEDLLCASALADLASARNHWAGLCSAVRVARRQAELATAAATGLFAAAAAAYALAGAAAGSVFFSGLAPILYSLSAWLLILAEGFVVSGVVWGTIYAVERARRDGARSDFNGRLGTALATCTCGCPVPADSQTVPDACVGTF